MQLNKLEVGCGPKDRWIKGTDGVDLRDFGQKYVGDIMTMKFDKKYDIIYAHHVIEHIPDTVALFDKFGDILNKNGLLDIRVPILPYEYSFVDPTHVKYIPSEKFFLYFTENSPAGHPYSKHLFEMIKFDSERYEWELHLIMKKI